MGVVDGRAPRALLYIEGGGRLEPPREGRRSGYRGQWRDPAPTRGAIHVDGPRGGQGAGLWILRAA